MALSPDPRQSKVIGHVRGPLLVLAGAGTGKTTVLTGRIARLIAEGHALPEEIVAITYTENAAAEMRAKLRDTWDLAPEVAGRVRLSTFDAYCFGILQEAGRGFRVLDDQDLWIYLRRRIPELGLREFAVARDPGQFLDDLLAFFKRCHDELVTPQALAAYVERLTPDAPLPRVKMREREDPVPPAATLARLREIARVFGVVEKMLEDDRMGTFSHMIVRARRLLDADSGLLAAERQRARFILIDEFQDSNAAQIELAQLLAGEDRNVFAVGDPDQAIYRFRGASTAAFERFMKVFPGAGQERLEENRRSTTPILQCSAAMIALNPEPAGVEERFRRRPLVSARAEEAEKRREAFPQPPVELVMTPRSGDRNLDTEAIEVACTIRDAHDREGVPWSSFAVLYRTHRNREKVVAELLAREIPFEVRGVDALDTPEGRDLVALLRAVEHPGDGEALFRVAALPVFALDSREVRDRLEAGGRSVDVQQALAEVRGGPAVMAALEKARREVAGKRPAAAIVRLVRDFGFDSSAPPLRAFLDFANKWQERPIVGSATVGEFLEYLRWFRKAKGSIAIAETPSVEDSPDGRVRLMTAHAAKGLEFDRVFILRANAQSFPLSYREPLFEFPQGLRREGSLAEQDSREIQYQEERRLFYVAMTRARDRLAICAKPGKGKKEPRPDGFLRDFMAAKRARPYWQQRIASPTIDVEAAAAAPLLTGVSAWLAAPPRASLAGITLSASSIDHYEACPLQFKIDKEWNLPGGPAAHMQFGTAMHTALKAYYDAVLAGRRLSRAELLRCFEEALADMPAEDPHQRELYLGEGREQLEEFDRRATAAPVPEVLGTERRFQMKLGGAVVIGRVDRIDRLAGNRVEIVDYKTGKPKDDAHAERSLQLSIYALAARDWGFEPERLTFHNLETNEAVTSSRSAAQLKAVEDRVRAVAERIAAGDFEPTPGHCCNSCEYRELCPATEQRLYSIRTVGAGVN